MPAKNRTQIIEDARLLCTQAQELCLHAKSICEKAVRTRAENKRARRRAEVICTEVGLKVWIMQTVRQVIKDRQRARKPVVAKGNKPKRRLPIPVRKDQDVWITLGRLSPHTSCMQ